MENRPPDPAENIDHSKTAPEVLPALLHASLESVGIRAVEESEDDTDPFDSKKRKKRRVRNYIKQLIASLLKDDSKKDGQTERFGEQLIREHKILPFIAVEDNTEALPHAAKDTDEYHSNRGKIEQNNYSQPEETLVMNENLQDHISEGEHVLEDDFREPIQTPVRTPAEYQIDNQEPGVARNNKDQGASWIGTDAAESLSKNPNRKLRKEARKVKDRLRKLEREDKKLKEMQRKQKQQIHELKQKREHVAEKPKTEKTMIPERRPARPDSQVHQQPPVPELKIQHNLGEVAAPVEIKDPRIESSPEKPKSQIELRQEQEISRTQPLPQEKIAEKPAAINPVEYTNKYYETEKRASGEYLDAAAHNTHQTAINNAAAQPHAEMPIQHRPLTTTQNRPVDQFVAPKTNVHAKEQKMYQQAVKTGALGGVIFILVFLALIALGVI